MVVGRKGDRESKVGAGVLRKRKRKKVELLDYRERRWNIVPYSQEREELLVDRGGLRSQKRRKEKSVHYIKSILRSAQLEPNKLGDNRPK